MEKNILIEEQDEVLRLIDQKELDEIEASAEEFDGFTGIRIVGRVQPEVKPATCGLCKNCEYFIDLDTPYLNFACNHPNIKLEMAIPDRSTFGCTYFKSKLSV